MDVDQFQRTRRALHGVAELLLAGPAYARDGDIRLRPTPGGFGVWRQPGPRIEGADLVADHHLIPLGGTVEALAEAARVVPRTLTDVYADGAGVTLADVLDVDPAAVHLLASAFSTGEQALRQFAPDSEPVLWPEHFDIGITVDEINYGVSPGDAYQAWPYAYVGPSRPRADAFFNAPFGAARTLSDLSSVEGIVAFFAQGRDVAAQT
jgi:hypothetical protein